MALSLIPFTNLTLIKRLIFSLDQLIFSLYIIDKQLLVLRKIGNWSLVLLNVPVVLFYLHYHFKIKID